MDAGAPPATTKSTLLVFLFVAAITGASFAWRAARVVTFEDAGALIAAAHVLGVPHPPGYPLWTMLAHVWAELGSIVGAKPAASLALFSAVAGGATCGVLAVALHRVDPLRPTAIVAGLALALLPTFASIATVVEVYALAAVFQAILVWTAIDAQPRPRLAWTALGLGLAAHPGTLFIAPLVFASSLRSNGRTSARAWLGWIGCATAGLALYFFVPLRSLAHPALDWGGAHTWPRFFDHVLRAQYAIGLERSRADTLEQGRFLVEQTLGQAPLWFAIAGLALLVFGRGVTGRAWLIGTLIFGALASALAIRYPLGRLDVFARWSAEVRLAPSFTPLVIATVAVAALGTNAATRRFSARVKARVATIMALLLVLPRCETAIDGQSAARDSRGAETWSHDVLDECPLDAVLVVARIGATDVLGFPLLHAQLVEGLRTDVVLVDRELLLAPWYREQLAARAPDLAPWVEQLGASLPDTSDRGLLHRSVGAALAELVMGARPLVYTDPPGPLALDGAPLYVHVATWQFIEPASDDASPSAPWLVNEPPSPWRELHRQLALERDEARASRLEQRGEFEAATLLLEASRSVAGPLDPRSIDAR